MSIRMFVLSLLSVAVGVVFAATETFNDLKPFDNTQDNAFWNTTLHPLRTVSAVSTTLANGFDSKATDVVEVALESFSTMPVGLLLILR